MTLRNTLAAATLATLTATGAVMAQGSSGASPSGPSISGGASAGDSKTKAKACWGGVAYDFKLEPKKGTALWVRNCEGEWEIRRSNCPQLEGEITDFQRDIEYLEKELKENPNADEIDAFGMGAITTMPRKDAEETLRALIETKANAENTIRKMEADPANRYRCPAVS